jgi:hypothetical protein
MSLILDLSKDDELRLAELARKRGIAPVEAARQLVVDNLPPPQIPQTTVSEKNAAAVAYLREKIRRGAKASPEEIRQAEEELEELKRNLNANRKSTGERLVFPE